MVMCKETPAAFAISIFITVCVSAAAGEFVTDLVPDEPARLGRPDGDESTGPLIAGIKAGGLFPAALPGYSLAKDAHRGVGVGGVIYALEPATRGEGGYLGVTFGVYATRERAMVALGETVLPAGAGARTLRPRIGERGYYWPIGDSHTTVAFRRRNVVACLRANLGQAEAVQVARKIDRELEESRTAVRRVDEIRVPEVRLKPRRQTVRVGSQVTFKVKGEGIDLAKTLVGSRLTGPGNWWWFPPGCGMAVPELDYKAKNKGHIELVYAPVSAAEVGVKEFRVFFATPENLMLEAECVVEVVPRGLPGTGLPGTATNYAPLVERACPKNFLARIRTPLADPRRRQDARPSPPRRQGRADGHSLFHRRPPIASPRPNSGYCRLQVRPGRTGRQLFTDARRSPDRGRPRHVHTVKIGGIPRVLPHGLRRGTGTTHLPITLTEGGVCTPTSRAAKKVRPLCGTCAAGRS